jgi:hypothetical protein
MSSEAGKAVTAFVQAELVRRGLSEVSTIEAARWLDQARVLRDSQSRPGFLSETSSVLVK